MSANEGNGNTSSSYLSHGSSTSSNNNAPKSLGTERTYAAQGISQLTDLKVKLRELCTQVSGELMQKSLTAQTVTLKLKTVKFELLTRSYTVASNKYIDQTDDIYGVAEKLLLKEIPITIRLMGVTMSKFRSENHGVNAFEQYFISNNTKNNNTSSNDNVDNINNVSSNTNNNSSANTNINSENNNNPENISKKDTNNNTTTSTSIHDTTTNDDITMKCPACSCSLYGSTFAMNCHIQTCLQTTTNITNTTTSTTATANNNKRSRKDLPTSSSAAGQNNLNTFFSSQKKSTSTNNSSTNNSSSNNNNNNNNNNADEVREIIVIDD